MAGLSAGSSAGLPAGLSVGVVGVGGVGAATASALVMRGLAGRVTIYSRDGSAARGLALDFMHARPLLSRVDVRGRSMDEVEREDILVITAGHHTKQGETRLDTLQQNVAVMESVATSVEAAALPGVALVVTNPLDVMTEYLTRRWQDRGVSVMGSGTALETLRLTDAVARACSVHPRSVHAWVVGEHGDSCVFLLDSAVVGTVPLVEFARQRGIELDPERLGAIERDVRTAAYQIRELKGSTAQGIGLTVGGLVNALAYEVGALIPVSTRVADGVCASLPCVLGPDGPSEPVWPQMNEAERAAWDRSLAVLADANAALPI